MAYSYDSDGQVIKNANIVLGAVAPVPLRAQAVEAYLEGKPIGTETACAAADIAVEGVKALSKNKYKVQIVKALIKKILS